MRTMYDSVSPDKIPPGSQLVAGYVDGPVSRWPDSAWSSFPGRTLVRITVLGGNTVADVIDYERGNASLFEVAQWVAAMRRLGRDPAVYCSVSARQDVVGELNAIGQPQPHWWLADWTNVPHLIPGTVATQWTSSDAYDTSAVADYWPGVDPAPPPPVIQEVDGMKQIEVPLVTSGSPAQGWVASPVRASLVVSALVIAPTPDGGQYYNVPTLAYITADPGPNSPNGVLVFRGGTPGSYAVQITALG